MQQTQTQEILPVLVQRHDTSGPRDCVQSRRLKGKDGGPDGPSTDENPITYGS